MNSDKIREFGDATMAWLTAHPNLARNISCFIVGLLIGHFA